MVASLVIPKNAFKQANSSFVYSFYHRTNKLFLTEQELKKWTGKTYNKNRPYVKSGILSASISNLLHLTAPVSIWFKEHSSMFGNETCQFWDFKKGMRRS